VSQCFIESFWIAEQWIILGWWAPLNSPDTILAHTLLNLQSLKSQNKWFDPKNPTRLTNINIWISEATWHCVNSQSRKIHTIMPVWIALWPWVYVSPSFCGSKNFLTLQMRYPSSEGRSISVFSDGIGHLHWVTKFAYSPQSQFIPTKTFSTSSTNWIYPIKLHFV
jgi:hypothetical protein